MHPFQESLHAWFSRKVPSRAQNKCSDFPLFLSTDIGLVRKENQDRVAAIHTGKKSINPLFAVAVADGMGGMRDGGLCATMALSSFFYALINFRNLNIRDRASEAIKYANDCVFQKYQGNGGSTLTAILIDVNVKPIFVHLGDSRIYTFRPHEKVERKTVDDSLAEAVGGSGRELLQFIGMGESMQPKIEELPIQQEFCAITTDGIHGVEESTLNKILENSYDIEQASLRLAALSRWCGGYDNSTSAMINMGAISEAIDRYEESGIRLWDAHGDLVTIGLRGEDPVTSSRQVRPSRSSVGNDKEEAREKLSANYESKGKRNSKSTASRKRKYKKSGDDCSESVQLDIEIGDSGGQGGSDVDRK